MSSGLSAGTITALAVGGATVGSSLIAANAAQSAANTQSAAAQSAAASTLQATNNTNALTAALYNQGQINQSPYLEGGQTALSALMSGLGLGPAQAYQSNTNTATPYTGTNLQGNGASGPATGISVTPGGGNTSGPPAYSVAPPPGATTSSPGATTSSPATAYGIGSTNYGATQAQLNAGAASVAPGSLTSNFNTADLMAGIDPGYAFRQQQGNANLLARQAATGNRMGGQALKDISDYNQNAASQEYQNAYNRYVTNQTNVFNRLSSVAGVGQTAANTGTAAGSNAASTIGSNTMAGVGSANNYLTSGAAAQAAGTIGATNAIVGGVNSGINNWYTGQLVNKYLNTPTTTGGS